MNVTHLQLSISDAALMTSSDGAYGEVALRASRKFGNPRLSALVAAAHAEMVAGFPSGRLFMDSVEQAMARVTRERSRSEAPSCRDVPAAGWAQRACEGLKSWSM